MRIAASMPVLHWGGSGSIGFQKGKTSKLDRACCDALQKGRSHLVCALLQLVVHGWVGL